MKQCIVISFALLAIWLGSCQTNQSVELKHTMEHTNALINESSPYLLQHAHNPVDWMPWGDKALQKAKEEDIPVIISIGYSSCHWCHVMEHESFSDSAVAAYMNDNFICIKVDREERPDVDQHYMDAVQLLTGKGGWPLNCFALPDGKAIYGGTYFTKEQWLETMIQVKDRFQNDREDLYELAAKVSNGIKGQNIISLNPEKDAITKNILSETVANWQPYFDSRSGGKAGAPKFPLPNNYLFLLNYGILENNEDVLQHVELTLDRMAAGGIYDQIGGGFARYATDDAWKIPHFEKMLYDNGQLLSLYSKAYQYFKKPRYKKVIEQIHLWLSREMTDNSGAFYSALDADSEGEEGKYYVWTKEEFQQLTGERFPWAAEYYGIGKEGRWEHGKNILVTTSNLKILKKHNLSEEEFQKQLSEVEALLYTAREERIRPGLDDKSLTSWNAIVISGLIDAYFATSDSAFLTSALSCGNWIANMQLQENGALYHSYKSGTPSIKGFLEDYAFTATAFQKLYEATGEEKWLTLTDTLLSYALTNFQDKEHKMFYFTEHSSSDVLSKKIEVLDNVVPASNSELAIAFFKQGTLLDDATHKSLAVTMLRNVYEKMPKYGGAYSNWGLLYLKQVHPYYEIAIVGNNSTDVLLELNNSAFIPQKVFLTSTTESEIPLLEGKFVEGQTTIYVCVNKACKLPVTSVSQALEQL